MIRNLYTGFLILGLVTLVGICLTNMVSLPDVTVRLILAGLAVAALLRFIFPATNRRGVKTRLTKGGALGESAFPDTVEIEDEYDAIMRTYNFETLSLFAAMLGNLPRYLTRINEHIEILEETPQLQVTKQQTYQVDNDNDALKICLVPLALIEKDTLVDNFVVKDSNNKDVPTLPHNRLRGLLTFTLESLIKTAIREEGQASEENQERTRKVAQDLVTAVSGPGPDERVQANENGGRKRSVEINQKIESALGLLPDLPTWRCKLRNFCEQYIDSHLIVAEVLRTETNENFLGLNYSHRVPLEGSYERRTPGRWWERDWRAHFGLKPQVLDIPLNPYAFLVESYHQQISAEPGEYIFDHHLERLKFKEPVTYEDLCHRNLRPYVRLHKDEGRPIAHLYIRRQLV